MTDDTYGCGYPATYVSLSCAISTANDNYGSGGGGSTIVFALPNDGSANCSPVTINGVSVNVCTLTLSADIPALTASNTTIDGYTQAGASANTNALSAGDNAVITVQVDDGSQYAGLVIQGSSDIVGSLALTNFHDTAVTVEGTGDSVAGNFIGVTPTGGAAGHVNDGVHIDASNGAGNNNEVGGASPAAANVIDASADNGVHLVGVSGNAVAGNIIGLNPAGASATDGSGGALANGADGILLEPATINPPATGNTIGGSAAGAGNVISGNGRYGAEISSTVYNSIAGNYVGTNAAGTAAVPNASDGVLIGGDHNTIGGPTTAAGNLIGGNSLAFAGTRYNVVEANLMGTSAAGTAALPNNASGVLLSGHNDVRGTACANCRVQVFIADPNYLVSGGAEGQTFVGDTYADSTGAWQLAPGAGTVAPGATLTATATMPAPSVSPTVYETSEFSASFTLPAGSMTIAAGWNLIDVPIQGSGIDRASTLAAAISGQLGTNAVAAVATFTGGRFNLYVPGYSGDLGLSSGQGILVLAIRGGSTHDLTQ